MNKLAHAERQRGSLPDKPTLTVILTVPPTEQTLYRILRLLQEQPDITQRQLARELGISLGKANYCLQALIEKGFVKAGNFKRNPHKGRYAYWLTTRGLKEKTRVTLRLLKQKAQEYEALKRELRQLRHEAGLIGETK